MIYIICICFFLYSDVSDEKSQVNVSPCTITKTVKPFFDSAVAPKEIFEALGNIDSFQSVSLIPWEKVKNECKKWLEEAVPSLVPLVAQQLKRVTTAEELSEVASGVQEFLSQPVPHWKDEPQRVLGDSTLLWENFLEEPLTERANEVIKSHFSGLGKGLVRKLDDVLAKGFTGEDNIGKWVWSGSEIQCEPTLKDTVKGRANFVLTPQTTVITNWFESEIDVKKKKSRIHTYF